MKKQALNPYLPGWEYIPDGEPRRFGDRVYVYGSHDRFGGTNYCENDYVCWSAPVSDLGDWRYEGVIFSKENVQGKRLFAPDVVQGPDGRFYLYYSVENSGFNSVAVCDTPAGKYVPLGDVRYPDGKVSGAEKGDWFHFDPGVLVDDDGRIYLFSGWNPPILRRFKGKKMHGPMVMELEPDMVTLRSGPHLLFGKTIPHAGFHSFFEASSPRKFEGKYYFVYSSQYSHELCYCMADAPMGPYHYCGVLHSNGNAVQGRKVTYPIGNNHGGILELDGRYYIFGHRHTNGNVHTRQGVAERLHMNADGTFQSAGMTSCGLNDGPLKGKGEYPAYIACHLTGKGKKPCVTQEGGDRNGGEDPYITGIRKGATVGFRYFEISSVSMVQVTVRGQGEGFMLVRTSPDGPVCCRIPIRSASNWTACQGKASLPAGTQGLYFTFQGNGTIDFKDFRLD